MSYRDLGVAIALAVAIGGLVLWQKQEVPVQNGTEGPATDTFMLANLASHDA